MKKRNEDKRKWRLIKTEELKKQIERVREELNKLIEYKDLLNDEVIAKSQELDRLFNKYSSEMEKEDKD